MSNLNSVIYSNVFLTDDCQKIFQNKFILFLGDSGINIFSFHIEIHKPLKIILYLFFLKLHVEYIKIWLSYCNQVII